MSLELNSYIDHTVLNPFAKSVLIHQLCREAIEYNFYAVCVSPFHLSLCQRLLEDSPVQVASVIGFPYGYQTVQSKASDISAVIPLVDEVDVVINLQALTDKNYTYLHDEIKSLTHLAHEHDKVIKWIVESGNIDDEQLLRLCEIANEVKIDFMKTSTGMLGAGASVEALTFMRKHLNDDIAIKASGGIRDRAAALAMIAAGATRIGASKSVQIVS